MQRDRTGQQLGNYRLIRLLGRGGFAEVYLGQHIRLYTLAAIKILHTYVSEDDKDVFQREAQIIASLVHPHIIRVLDFDVREGVPFLVIDYAPNGSLRQVHPHNILLPQDLLLSYTKQVAEALQYAHDQNLVHRDVKPENMLVGRHWEILLSDFGIATIAHSTSSQYINTVVGSVAYMAPEQVQGKVCFASDQYALATTVYEWLCGVRPFTGTATEVALQQALAAPTPLHEKRPDIPQEVEQVVMQALQKDPHTRFPTILSFAQALEVALHNHPHFAREAQVLSSNSESWTGNNQEVKLEQSASLSHPVLMNPALTPVSHSIIRQDIANEAQTVPIDAQKPSPVLASSLQIIDLARPALQTSQPSSLHRLHPVQAEYPTPHLTVSRRAFLFGGASILLAAGGTGAAIWYTSTQQIKITTLTTFHQRSTVNTVDFSPDTHYVVSGGNDGLARVWGVESKNDHTISTYHGHHGAINAAVWSPDGGRIASASADRTVQIWNPFHAEQTLFAYQGHTSDVQSVAWSPDGKQLLSASDDTTVQLWDFSNTTSALTVYRDHHAPVQSLAWARDGKLVASASTDMTARIWDPHANENTLVTYNQHTAPLHTIAWSPDGKWVASAGEDTTAHVWSPRTGKTTTIYHGHTEAIHALSWSPDSQYIATASKDRTIQIWNAFTGKMVLIYSRHQAPVQSVSWKILDKQLVSGGNDNTAQVWRFS